MEKNQEEVSTVNSNYLKSIISLIPKFAFVVREETLLNLNKIGSKIFLLFFFILYFIEKKEMGSILLRG